MVTQNSCGTFSRLTGRVIVLSMRILTVCILIVLSSLMICAQNREDRWKSIATDHRHGTAIHLLFDTRRFRRKGYIIDAWIKVKPEEPFLWVQKERNHQISTRNQRRFSEELVHTIIDCSNSTEQILEAFEYDKYGNFLERLRGWNKPQSVTPDSLGDAIADKICSYDNRLPFRIG
jgi:hypothetical protein